MVRYEKYYDDMRESKKGKWVLYQDYAALEVQLDHEHFISETNKESAKYWRGEAKSLESRLQGVRECAEYFFDYSQLQDRDYDHEYWEMCKKLDVTWKAVDPIPGKE